MRKRLKKTVLNTKITHEPFENQPTKILSIFTFIDDYNHYIGEIDQSNQLQAAFTTHFSWNQKEFFSEAFWTINLAVYNSYKLHLAFNGYKTSFTNKRDPQEHREWIEELIKLLFQVQNNDFKEEITSKPYPEYIYQPVLKGPKSNQKEAVLEQIDDFSNHQYSENPSKKRGYCVFCIKKAL